MLKIISCAQDHFRTPNFFQEAVLVAFPGLPMCASRALVADCVRRAVDDCRTEMERTPGWHRQLPDTQSGSQSAGSGPPPSQHTSTRSGPGTQIYTIRIRWLKLRVYFG